VAFPCCPASTYSGTMVEPSDLRVADANPEQPASLHRYTNLAATIHMLCTKCITLLNPATWDDKNDAYFMAEYKRTVVAGGVAASRVEGRKRELD
jgi:hypothetical protein